MTEHERICVELKIDLKSTENCTAILSSVKVDDIDLPSKQQISARECIDSTLRYVICSIIERPEDVLSLWNTVDDIIRSIKAATSVIEKVK